MEPRLPRLPLTVLALGATSFFNDVASEMVFPLLPGFLALLGAGPTFLGLLEGVADAVSALLKYLAGLHAPEDVRVVRDGLVAGPHAGGHVDGGGSADSRQARRSLS
ncbi:MAG: hypothetical protein AMXMBFR34_16600 [Myxococcaceae bacterium]